MKANRRAARAVPLRDDERAVSTVLGAVLMFGLLVSTLVTIRVKYVPVWDRERESDLMQQVAGQFAAMKADADHQAVNQTATGVTDPLTLSGASGFRFFASPVLPSSVAFAPAPSWGGFHLAPTNVHITSQNGQRIFGGSEQWTAYTPAVVHNVSTIQHLRLYVLDPDSYSGGQSLTFTLTDTDPANPGAGQTRYAGQFVLNYLRQGQNSEIYVFELLVYAANNPTVPITQIEESFNKQDPVQSTCPVTPDSAPHNCLYIDLLRPDLEFRDVILAASAPYTATEATNGLTAYYTMTYDVQTGGGTTTVGGTGRAVNGYALALPSGAIVYTSQNQRYPPQTYTLEHGAVILQQPEGSVMMLAPQFTVSKVAGQTNVNWVVPGLSGSAAAIGGSQRLAAMNIEPTGARIAAQGTAPKLSFTITTSYGSVWTQYWTTVMQQAGLTSTGGQPQFSVSFNATAATLNVFGVQSDPASTLDDIAFNLFGAALTTTARASATG